MLAITFHGESSNLRSRIYVNGVKKALHRVCGLVKCPPTAVVAVIFVRDQKMRELNRKYRGKDKATNVLAFPNQVSGFRFQVSGVDLVDVFISIPEARREAKKYGWTLNYEIARLAVHGFLHLLGYEHGKEKEARRMEQLEQKILYNF